MSKQPSSSQARRAMTETDTASALPWLWLSLLVIALDQASKIWISQSLELYQSIAVFPSFNLTLLHNPGAAFSFLATAGGWQRWFFSSLAVVISIAIIVWLRRLSAEQKWLAAALALILGGAVGNVVDRLLYGYVIDFLDIYYQGWHWPAFNLADSAITVGAIMLIVDVIREPARQD